MKLSTQGYKGTRDFYPEDKRLQKAIFSKLREVVESFGYQEYDGPLIEPLEVYAAKSGDELVNEQLYSFTDRGERKVAIRPEMTPTVSRMVAARRQELAYPLRLYSIPNLWRYERPQRGRLREHWQLNVDLFGVEGLEADHEIILVANQILKAFGAKADSYSIRINSRRAMNAQLEQLSLSDQQKKLAANLIDKRTKIDADDFSKLLSEAKATKLLTYLKGDHRPPENVAKLLALLKQSGVTNAVFEPSVVRGLAYYTDIVFEVYDTHPDNNRAMFGGGRYDSLVEIFGVAALPVVGFGMGDVTLQNFLELHKLLPKVTQEIDATVILIGDVYEAAQKSLADLRAKGLHLAIDATDRKADAKIKSAAKAGASHVIFIGQQELDSGQYKLKDLKNGEEVTLSADELAAKLARS